MDSQSNGHTARDKLAATPLPNKDNWAAFKAAHAAAAKELELADAAADDERRLKEMRKLACEVKYLTFGECRDRWARINAILNSMTSLTKYE